MAVDRDALLCDLAEVYHIYDFRALPVHTLAALACGLRADSRIMMKLAGVTYIPQYVMMAAMADNARLILHSLTAKKNAQKPKLFAEALTESESKGARTRPTTAAQMATFAKIRAEAEAHL